MGLWRFRGPPHYLNQLGRRLAISEVLVGYAKHNHEIRRVGYLLGQLSERYRSARLVDGKPALYQNERDQIAGTLGQCERECAKLHTIAAATAAMIDEAYAAFEITQPPRLFGVEVVEPIPHDEPANGDTPIAAVAGKAKGKRS
jgi:hypothetical protein